MTVGFNYLGKMGQLGNQMFQFAITKVLHDTRGLHIPLIPNHEEVMVDGLGNKLRILLFDCFNIKPENTGILKTDYVVAEKNI